MHKALLILIIIGIALTGFIFYINQKPKTLDDALSTVLTITPAPSVVIPENITDQWVPYTSPDYGFSLKHPFDMKHDMTTEGERFYKLGPTQSTGTELYDGINVIITAGSLRGDSFETFVNKEYEKTKSDPVQPRLGEKKAVTIAGKEGIAFSVSSLGDITVIYLPKNENEYLKIINGTVEPENREQTFQKTVDTMLSSLTF